MSGSRRSHTDYPLRVDALTVKQWLDSPNRPRLLDVRTSAEFEAVHIPGSYNVPLETLREHREEPRARIQDELELICRSGIRAGPAARALVEVGRPNVHVLDGGMTAWQAHRRSRGPQWSPSRLVYGGRARASRDLTGARPRPSPAPSRSCQLGI
jgi:rhodanese-related sulfurtransferase